jgi:hypothetical protein
MCDLESESRLMNAGKSDLKRTILQVVRVQDGIN